MAKHTFKLRSEEKRRDLPGKIIVGQEQTETTNHVVLKLLAYVLFFRERIQIEPNLDIEYLQFTPDIVQLDYELRPRLWVECGECGVHKLHKLAVKVPEAPPMPPASTGKGSPNRPILPIRRTRS